MAKFDPTPSQRAAMATRGGAVLVSAAAGSGKTTVLVDRIMGRICDPEDPKNIDDFLIITFTEKAAAELRTRITGRISALLGEHSDNAHLQRQLHRSYVAQISTIDGLCSSLCREYAYELNLPADFRILEGKDRDALQTQLLEKTLEEVYAAWAGDEDWQALLTLVSPGRDDRALGDYVLRVYDHAQCHLYPDAWMAQSAAALQPKEGTDAGDTPWGRLLLDRLKDRAARACALLETACRRITGEPVLETKYLPKFREDLAGLETLRDAETWDQAAGSGFKFQSLSVGGTKFPDPELKDWAKAHRDRAKKLVEEALEPFFASSAEMVEDLRYSGAALQGLFRLTREFARRYDGEKQRLHLLDFGDLEHGAVRLLLYEDGTPTPIARELSTRYEELLLDEYQDTNQVQDLLFKALSRDGKNRFMVGDVKQAIYSFRLADPGIFLDKYQRYQDWFRAEPGESRRVLLSENFRSRPGILEAVNAVFSLCMSPQVGGLTYGEEEMLRPGGSGTDLSYPPVELHCMVNAAGTEEENAPEKRRTEAEFTARRIRQLLDAGTEIRDKDGTRPVQPGDIAILLRAVKGSAHYYVEALAAQGIACVCETGNSIFDTEELEQMLSLLRVLDNAHRDVPLAGTLLSPLFGFTPDQLGTWCAGHVGPGLYETLAARAETEPALGAFFRTLEDLRQAAETLPLHRLMERILEATSYEAVLASRPDGAARLANVRRLVQLAADYEAGGQRSLRQFVAYLEGMKEQGLASPVEVGKNAVTLLSVHKSKGLEYPVVLLPDLSKEFNREDLKRNVLLHGELGAGGKVLDRDHKIAYPTIAYKALSLRLKQELLSEEQRVLYVAMTRAKDLLIMLYCDARLESRLTALAGKAEDPLPPETASEVISPGAWVLLAALQRAEAGALQVWGRPQTLKISDHPWVIRLHDASPQSAAAAADPEDREIPGALPTLLQLPPDPGSSLPAKLTATQLKGRHLDEEVSEGAPVSGKVPAFRSLSLLQGERPLTAAEKGTATHLAMQYLDFSRTDSETALQEELDRMVDREFLTREQAAAVSPAKLLRVFTGPLGDLLRGADKVIREFKFSVLTDAGAWYPEAAGEQLMLQGVTDCCLIKDGGLTVVDFKTDRFAPGKEGETAARYRGQLEAYSLALSRIFGMSVEKKFLYFFHTDTLYEVK